MDHDQTRRMIIQVILRGDNRSLPPKIAAIQSHSFTKFQMAGRPMRKNGKFIEKIQAIVEHIYSYYKDLKDLEKNGTILTANCDSFALPSKGAKSTGRSDLPLRNA